MALLHVDAVDTFYGLVRALESVNLQVHPGEFVALIGANGAGKSTLLKTIIGVQPVSAGHIRFEDKEVDHRRVDRNVRAGISLVPEGRRIFATLTVQENLLIGCITKRVRRDMTSSHLADVYEIFPRLAERKNQLAGTMSGGEQQMLAVGRALMSKPKLLLLDEPSIGLAPLIIKDLMEVFRKIHQGGTAILLVEQNVPLALEAAQRAYLLETGRVVLEGRSAEIMNNDEIRRSYLGMD